MQIIINPKLISTLERLSNEQKITVEECVQRNIEAYLLQQFRLNIVKKIDGKNLDDMATIEIEVLRIDEEVKVRDILAAPAE